MIVPLPWAKKPCEFIGSSKQDLSAMTKVTRSSGNIFADIGMPDAEEHELKARVVLVIAQAIEVLELTQTAAAARTGIAQPDLSKILRGQFAGFSLERLLGTATKLGSDVEIKIKSPKKKQRTEFKGQIRLFTA